MSFCGVKIAYPCLWHGRIIVRASATGAREQLETALRQLGHAQTLETGSRSSQGTYQAFAVQATLQGDGELERIVGALQAVEGVTMVM